MTPPPASATALSPDVAAAAPDRASAPVLTTEPKAGWENVALAVFIAVPFLALVAAIPFAWGWGLGWRDVVLAVLMYAVTGHGITVGFHRYFTHGSFKANRPLRIALAVAGSMAIEGPVTRWVADHRRHHAFSDDEGDPHSPWRYGNTFGALCKGLGYAHVGWLFDVEQTDQKRFAPDLLADKDIARVSKLFPWLVAPSAPPPPAHGGLWSMSWMGALTAYFWASLVRICVLHHTTWSINSICHSVGNRPFVTKDRS